MSSTVVSQDYRLVEEVLADGDIPISLYENQITGLKVVVAHAECPIVKLDLVFATEAFDDDGLPHTLEHLIFLGSEGYPFKGVLDLLANRCFASGTNACTDTDNTIYTMSTAGKDGFLNLLPVYLDHVLFPTLTDSAYITEVHHINGDGEDAGVVYCEMQARENSGDSRCYLEMLRQMYPGKCGYKSETGGLVSNLRESTNNTKVRQYHKEFYHSKNLCVVATGPIKAEEIFASIKPIEDKIVAKGMHKLEFQRPWQAPIEPLNKSVRRTVQYPSDTDNDGLVYIGFRGPNVVHNLKDFVALGVLLDYLDSTPISPIQREFVECDEPLCSSVSHNLIENSTSCIYMSFDSVGKQYYASLTDKFLDLLRSIQEGKEKLDMSRLKTVISRMKVGILSMAESSPHKVIIGPVVGHFLYGTGKLADRAQEIPLLEEFVEYDADFWLKLMDKYLTGPEARYVSVVGEPSPDLMKSMADEEKQRLADQKENLKDQLPGIAKQLHDAIEQNEIPAPDDMLSSCPIPSTDNIRFHPIERAVLNPTESVPFRVQYDSIKTNFVTAQLIMDTSNRLSKTDRLYLPLLSEILLECPIERDDKLVPYETVVAELFSDTVSNNVSIGLSSSSTYSVGQIGMVFSVQMQVEVEKYTKSVQWFREILYKTLLTPERIKTVATRLVSDISQYKRSGSKVCASATNSITYQSDSNQWAANFLRQQKFLKKLLKSLKENPESVQKRITQVRDKLTTPDNFLVHITLNKDKIDVSKLREPWIGFVPAHVLESSASGQIKLDQITPCRKLVEFAPSAKAVIVGVGSAESNFMNQLTKSINSLDDPDLAPVFVLINYLTQLEGPMWRQVRGLGLSYHYSIYLSPSEGLMHLHLYKSTQLVAAYSKMLEIVKQHASGEEEFKDSLLEPAKSSLIYELISQERSAAGKSMQSLVAYLRGLDIDYNKKIIEKVACVTKADLRRVCPLYLEPLFKDPERRAAVCCHPSKVDEITSGLSAFDCKLEPLSLDQDTFWNSIE